jgi:hypothetical protein
MINLKAILIIIFIAYSLSSITACNHNSNLEEADTLDACYVPQNNYACVQTVNYGGGGEGGGGFLVQETESIQVSIAKHLLPPTMCHLLNSQVQQCSGNLCSCATIRSYLDQNGYQSYANALFGVIQESYGGGEGGGGGG